MFSYFVTFLMEIFSLMVDKKKNSKKKFSTKNNKVWKRYTHESEHEIKNISSHDSTYFLTFYINQMCFLSFFMLSNGAIILIGNYNRVVISN